MSRRGARFFLLMGHSVLMGLWALFACLIAAVGEIARCLVPVRPRPSRWSSPSTDRVSVVIPTWNGKEMLDMCLAELLPALRAEDEVIVVDNASTDGTQSYLEQHYPRVKIVRLSQNEGFRGGCQAGLHASTAEIVIFLNNDMVVERGFLEPLLKPFRSCPELFAVTAQIYFWDKDKPREETGLTRPHFHWGLLRPSHDVPTGQPFYPVLYAGGGSSAFDRRKLLELNGFDELFDPFYVEDLDLSYRAWMKGWPSLIAPQSVVYHKHRGTIGSHFSRDYIEKIVERNNLLFAWRNFDFRHLLTHFPKVIPYLLMKDWQSDVPFRTQAFWAAVKRSALVGKTRWREQANRRLKDEQICQLSSSLSALLNAHPGLQQVHPNRNRKVLLVCPYSPYPPVHGGAVRMYHLIEHLKSSCDVYLATFVESVEEERALAERTEGLAGVWSMRRKTGWLHPFSLYPNSVREFYSAEFANLLQQIVDHEGIDIVQYEYTQMALYLPLIKGALPALTEHDLSSVGIARKLTNSNGFGKVKMVFSLVAMYWFERKLLRQAVRVFSVTKEEGDLLRRLFHLPNVCDRVISGADVSGIQRLTRSSYDGSRTPRLLFVGNFRHSPNVEGFLYFHQNVWPLLMKAIPNLQIQVVGAAPPDSIRACANDQVMISGYVENLQTAYEQANVVICPILSGAGVRIKLLESMAYGVPFVSTTMGAEGLLGAHGEHYLLADDPVSFAEAIASLIFDRSLAERFADKAYQLLVDRYSWEKIAGDLLAEYEQMLAERQVVV